MKVAQDWKMLRKYEEKSRQFGGNLYIKRKIALVTLKVAQDRKKLRKFKGRVQVGVVVFPIS